MDFQKFKESMISEFDNSVEEERCKTNYSEEKSRLKTEICRASVLNTLYILEEFVKLQNSSQQ